MIERYLYLQNKKTRQGSCHEWTREKILSQAIKTHGK